MGLYEVGIKYESSRIRIDATSSTEAKRKYCKQTGRNYNDPFNGAGALTARRLKENGESGAGEERKRGAVENAD